MAKKELMWSKKDLCILHYLAKKGKTIDDIAKELNRSRNSIVLTAKRYGIQTYQPGRKWLDKDRDFLCRTYGKASLWYLSSYLHRSPQAIVQMAHKMRLDPIYRNSEDLGLTDFIRATGIKRERILNTLAPKHGFPLIKRKNGAKQSYYYVDFDKILDWMEQHQNLYDASKIDDGFFIEPPWLIEKRRRDREDNSYLHWTARRKLWQEPEISTLKQMAKDGKTPREIGEKLKRSESGVIDKMWKIQM